MRMLGKAELGATTFCGASYPNDKCGANGLPLTPNSIKILGRFQKLKTLDHPRLCKYIHLVRGKHERVMVVSEHYRENLKNITREEKFSKTEDQLQLAYDILDGLAYLNSHEIVHRSLSPENVLLDTEGRVKLREHGLYYMTDYGADVSFPVGKPKYLAPEVLAQGPVKVKDGELDSNHPPSGPKVDIWSLGIILLEIYLNISLWSSLTLQQIFYKIIGFLKTDTHPLDLIAKEHGITEKIKLLPQPIVDLLRLCLLSCPHKRPTPKDLIATSIFQVYRGKEMPCMNGFSMFSTTLRCKNLEIPSYDEEKIAEDEVDLLAQRSIDEVFYLWGLAGGDLESALKKAGLIRSRPPITALAKFVTEDGELFGQDRDRSVLLDDTVVILSQEQLRQRLQSLEDEAYFPLLEDDSVDSRPNSLPTSPSSVSLSQTVNLPLVIREKDVEYQFHRIVLYDRLLQAYPYKRPRIWQEARVDIPPLVRAKVWAAGLIIEGDVYGRYDAIDKETPTVTDRQIEVDVPRCHQYNELLSSPTGHAKFKRLLKAWVVSHPQYVYWQGLDSLCAPFLYLNFNDEALACSCMSAFISKYLHNFFLKDNSPIIQEYLAVFSHLITFIDPELANHLDGIGFIPDLYAIPWFLTMYAHVFPLHKIFHLWDTLLLGNSSFPLCIGVAILQQLKDQLLSFGFNECILLFSDMPEIDIEKCVQDSIKIFCQIPKSATYRHHARPLNGDKRNERPKVSYYTQDYSEVPKTELSMEPIPIQELKSMRCPYISAEDLIELSELKGSSPTRSPTKSSIKAKPKIIIIDVRNEDEYNRGTIPDSMNMPHITAFTPEGDLVPCPAVQKLNSYKNHVKVIVGSRGKSALQFAESLLKLKYSKVSILYKGIDVLRPTGLLVVPPPEL